MSTTTLIDPYGLWTFIGTMILAIATMILAVVTYWSTRRNQEVSKQERRLTELRTKLNEYYGPVVFLLGQGNNTDCAKLLDILRTKPYLREDTVLDPLLKGCGIYWNQQSGGQFCTFTSPNKDIWHDFFDQTWDSYIKVKKEIAIISGVQYKEEEKPPYELKVAVVVFNLK